VRHVATPVQQPTDARSPCLGDSVFPRAPDTRVLAGVWSRGRYDECQGPLHAYRSRTQHSGGVALFEQLSAMNTHGTKRTKLRPRAPHSKWIHEMIDAVFVKCVSLPEQSYFSIWCRRASLNHLDRRDHEDAIFIYHVF
jgi:hypothetical protein